MHGHYIIAQTSDGLVIVDQHAAHERIVYEKLKRQREGGAIERQALLSPLVVDLEEDAAALIDDHAAELAGLGLVVEGFGPGAVLVREAPAIIAQGDLAGLVRDLAADLAAEDGAQSLARRLDRWLGTFACRHSVRSGRTLRPEEMNALLREMESTRAPANATTAARPMLNSSSPTSSGCSGGGEGRTLRAVTSPQS